MRDHLKKAFFAAAFFRDLGALAAGITLTARIPVCPTGPVGGSGGGSSSGVVQSSKMTLKVNSTKCSGNSAESCGSNNTGIVYTFSPPPGSGVVSVTTYTTTLPGGSVSTVASSTTLSPSLPGSVSVTTYTTTLPGGLVSTVTSSTTLPGSPSGSVSATTYTTTLPGGSVSTVTSSTTLPASPSGSISATTYTTTLPGGSVSTVTSSTTVPPPPPGGSSTSVTTYTTTGPGGTPTVVTSSSIVVPPPAGSTVVSTIATVNSQGSSVTTTQTTVIPPPISSSGPSPSSYTAVCAGSGLYSDNLGALWHLQCGIDYPGYDLPTISVSSFEACLESCDTYSPSADIANGAGCVGVSYGAREKLGECYRKYNVSETRYFPGFDSGYKDTSHVVLQPPTSFSVIPPSTTVIVQSSTNAQGSVLVTSTTSTAPNGPLTTVITQSSTNAQGSVAVTSTTSTAANPNYSGSCGGTYRDLYGVDWHVDCGTAYPGNDLPAVTVTSFESCLETCDNYVPNPNIANGASCVAVTYGIRTKGGECYLKSTITQTLTTGGQDSCYKIGSGVRPPVSSPNAPGVTSSSSTPNAPGGTSSSSTPWGCSGGVCSSPSAVAPGGESSTSTPWGCPGGVCSSSPGAISSPTNTNVPSTPASSTTSSASANPSAAFQPCPLSNNQQYVDRSGAVYDISCSCEYPGYDLTTPHAESFQDCMYACDTYIPNGNVANGADCIAATWSYGNPGGNCYLKWYIGEVSYGNPNDCSAKSHNYTIPNSVSSTSSSFTSASTSTDVPVPPTSTTSSATSTSSVPAMISITAHCPADRGAHYTDSYGQVYEIHCDEQVNGANAYSAFHADSFEKCVNICEVLGGCAAATYPGDVIDNTQSNCYPYTDFNYYSQEANTQNLLSARVYNGTTNAQFANSVTLCPSSNGQQFTDPIGKTYIIECDRTFNGGTANLFAAVTYTLEACLAYCSLYNTCVGATFTGYNANDPRNVNCHPYSSVVTNVFTVQSGTSMGYIPPV
ncbi:MAG: hypothetical protein Q9170_005907 [Blastenia crenularia]